MKVCVIGAGAMGGSFGALLARAGNEVRLVDAWPEHIAAIERHGLKLTGVLGDYVAELAVCSEPDYEGWADWSVMFTDSNATVHAARIADRVLKEDGCAVTMQNGIGNVEKLVEVLGDGRVVGGSSMSSAAVVAPGEVAFTHLGPTTIGELDGTRSPRLLALGEMLREAGFEVALESRILAKIWNKFVLNCAVNALCAVSGMRCGEMARVPELFSMQDRIIDEALAVVAAKGLELPDPDIRTSIKNATFYKFNKPSMLQHIEAGKRTEIDAINGALVREAHALGVAAPYNEALVALLKGVEQRRRRELTEPEPDFDAWERRIADEPLPAP